MSASPIINGLMIFFTVTTIVVIAFPIIKLLPSRLERGIYRRIAFHRDAVAALDRAIDRTTADAAQRARLVAQAVYHRNALAALAPDDPLLSEATTTRLDAAA